MAFYSLKKGESLSELSNEEVTEKTSFWKSRKFKISLVVAFVLLAGIGGFTYYKASNLFNKISTGDGSLLGGLFKGEEDLKGVEEGRINFLLLGMRGSNMPGGSLLSDTIMIVSIKPNDNKIAMISVPRDLHVAIPGHGERKINSATSLGESAGEGKGMELMKQVIENVTGLQIHYVATANFQALRDMVNTLDGVVVHLDKPFSESSQFVEGNECGGIFALPAGDVKLNGEQALCYSRARYNSSDFDRARRQQDVLMAMKDKALSSGTLTDFSKVNGLFDIVGDNVKTTMEPWEMQKMFGIYQKMDNPGIIHKVIDNGKDGLLYSTTIDTSDGPAYILLPKGGNFDQIKQLCANIFDEEAVKSIVPVEANGYDYVSEPKTQGELKKKKDNSNNNSNSNVNSNVNSNSNKTVTNKNSNVNSNKNSNSNSNKNSNKNDNDNKKSSKKKKN